MFTGIIEDTGQVIAIDGDDNGYNMTFKSSLDFSDVKLGDSIAVNGVCLTVTHLENSCFSIQAVPETLRKTNLGQLQVADEINIERSMLASTRIGGHFVQGHVDGVSEIVKIEQEGEAQLVTFAVPECLSRYIVDKGFITIDGMSITVINISGNHVLVTFIPHTREVTVVKHYQAGRLLNIEVDMMAKYIEKLMSKIKVGA